MTAAWLVAADPNRHAEPSKDKDIFLCICSERNLVFAGGVIGGTGNGERGGLGGERGGRRLKFEGRMINREQKAVPEV